MKIFCCSKTLIEFLILFFIASEASLLNFPSKNLKKLVPDNILNPSFKGFSEVSSSHDIESEFLLSFA